MACMWRSEVNLWELVLSFYHVCARDGTHIVQVGGQHLSLLSYLADPFIIYFESGSHAVAQADLILLCLENILPLTVISLSA